MPLILGTNSIKDTTYDVANSLRFNGGSSDHLTRTPSSTGNRRTFTMSLWIKRSKITDNYPIMFKQITDASNFTQFYIDNQDQLTFYVENGSGSGYTSFQNCNILLRDPSSWYHVMASVDTTQASADNRVKIYVNGTQQTSFNTNTQINQNIDVAGVNTTGAFGIGYASNNNSQHWNGYMAEVVFVDGTALSPTDLGEFDEDSPNIWKPKDVSGLTFGTNGFYLDFENSSNLGADVSGNGNNFTANNLTSTSQSIDTCTNNFATLNPLNPIVHDFEEGNLRIDATASNWDSAFSTIGASSGKWYFELKFLSKSSEPLVRSAIGVVDARGQTQFATNEVGYTVSGASGDSVGYNGNGSNNIKKNDSAQYSGTNWNVNDIICMAVDLDNGAVYFRVNDSAWLNSGDPTSGSTKTGAVTITTGETYVFGGTAYDASTEWQFNFGAPSFSISSGNADANGHGNFEYAVPSGYFALCTKNLAENG